MGKLPSSTCEHWASFVSGSLADTNARNVVTPAHAFHGHNASSRYKEVYKIMQRDDLYIVFSDDEDLEGSFHHDSNLQQMFADYQMQQMSEHFVDSFGLAEESGDDGT